MASLLVLFSVCHFCHQCGDPFKNEDIIVLNGTKEEVQMLRVKMEEKRAKAKTKVRINLFFFPVNDNV